MGGGLGGSGACAGEQGQVSVNCMTTKQLHSPFKRRVTAGADGPLVSPAVSVCWPLHFFCRGWWQEGAPPQSAEA